LGWGSAWKEDPFQLWHGSQADEPYSSNFVRYRNPRVDALIDRLRVTLDEKRQIPLYHEIDRLIYEDQPYTFLFAEDATSGYNARLDDVRFYRIAPCINIPEWRSPRPAAAGP
jgi:ABC-type transport system substrate-binding protein